MHSRPARPEMAMPLTQRELELKDDEVLQKTLCRTKTDARRSYFELVRAWYSGHSQSRSILELVHGTSLRHSL